MGSLRALSVLLVLLVLVPGGVLAWLGFRAADLLEVEAAGRLRRELDDAERDLRAHAETAAQVLDTEIDRAVVEAAVVLRRDLPFEEGDVVLRRVRTQLRDSIAGPRHLHGVVAVRLVDAAGRGLLPPEYVPPGGDEGGARRLSPLEDLRRAADRLRYGDGGPEAAQALWATARAKVPTAATRAVVAAEMALLEVGTGRTDAAAAARELEADLAPLDLLQAGRPVLRLWFAAAPEDPVSRSWLARAEATGALDRTALTWEERRRARAWVAEAVELPPDDPRTWPPYDQEPTFVVRGEVKGGTTLEVTLSEGWAWLAFDTRMRQAWQPPAGIAFGVDRPENVHPEAYSALGATGQRAFVAPGWRGHPAGYSLTHHAAGALRREVQARRRWTLVGVAALVLLMAVGLALVMRAVGRERAARRLRDDFIANVSHELRTPLTSVCFHAEMLAEEDPPADRRRHLARVVSAQGARLATLVDDLLDFAALERGVRSLDLTPVDLSAIARAATAPYQVLAEQEGVTLAVDTPEHEIVALADASALSRTLANLVANAWRHGRPSRDGGPGRIRVRVRPGAAPADAPMVEVRDDGPGIPTAERRAVFERFRRGRHTGRVEGAGLGLALCRELARAMGGDVAIVDDPKETVFRLTLPHVPDEEGT